MRSAADGGRAALPVHFESGWAARSADLARRLGVTRASVDRMLQALAADDLVTRREGRPCLTPAGEQAAQVPAARCRQVRECLSPLLDLPIQAVEGGALATLALELNSR